MPSERLVALMEMLRIYADKYLSISNHLSLYAEGFSLDLEGSVIGDPDKLNYMRTALEELEDLCESGDLPVTKLSIETALFALRFPAESTKNRTLKMILERIVDRLPDELSTKLFLQVPHSRRCYFDEPQKGWGEIIERFPDCIRDVEEMNKCFALSRYTASMFHAMHIAEWGAIDLGNHVGVTDPVRGWGATTKQLAKLVADGRSKFPVLDVTFEFVEMMNQEAGTMKLAWRNKIDHAANHLTILPNTDFTPDIAEHITKSVKVFMGRIMEGIK